MEMTRRDMLAFASALAAVGLIGIKPAEASTELLEEAINKFAGGMPESGGVSITAPEIAENGNTVPVEVEAPGATDILILADGNPNPDVATMHFGKLAAEQRGATRIRLAKTQNVVAVAKMQDGTYRMAKREVKVTIGGCGG
ncbi:MAG: thiosulfate oxidation carrier protein SoxY [Alphaproteobacteria bacterium]|nr:thiosulfate oxidation carrier protein SoxY [Alphaproteobacteria bacterium]